MKQKLLAEYDLAVVLPDSRPEIRSAIAAYVRRAAAEFAGDVLSVTLYGSQARGEAGAESDIDLFVVVCRATTAVRQALADLAWQVQFEHDVVISDVVFGLDQLSQMQAEQFPYYQNLEREGILLWKSTSELSEVAALP